MTPVQMPLLFARDSDTSAEAAISIAHDTPRLREFVLSLIRQAGARGMTADEIELHSGLRHQTASARVVELRNLGWIVDSGERRLTRSNRRAAVWVAP